MRRKQFSFNHYKFYFLFNAAQTSYKEYKMPKNAPTKVKISEVWNF